METVHLQKIPRHLAIIMDGNGRWAQLRSLPRIEGHRKGAESVRSVVRSCRRIGVKVLTLYAFSLENWRRPAHEVKALMALLKHYLRSELKEMLDNGIRLRTVGRIEDLNEGTRKVLLETVAATAHNRDMILNLALSYVEVENGSADPDQLTEERFADYLDTGGLPEPDLLIRTSGERRVSNFLLWQIAYTEIYFTETLWPDFSDAHLLEALRDYERRERRFGRISEQLGDACSESG
jgi:undecaprenyl diphosphate synthase